MRHFFSRSFPLLLVFALVLLSPIASAQITGVNNATSTPFRALATITSRC